MMDKMQYSRGLGDYPVTSQLRGNGFSYPSNQTQCFWEWRKHPRIRSIRNSIRSSIAAILGSSKRFQQTQNAIGLVNALENQLFINAASEEAYADHETLMDRLHSVLQPKSTDTKGSVQIENNGTSVMVKSSPVMLPNYCNGVAPQLPFLYSENAYSTSCGYNIVPEKNTCLSGISKGHPFCTSVVGTANNVNYPFCVQAPSSLISKEDKYISADSSISSMPKLIKRIPSDTVLSLGETSTITTYSDGDGFSNGVAFSSPQNLENSSASSFCYQFEQQNLDAGSSQENESVALISAVGEHKQSSGSNSVSPRLVDEVVPHVSNNLNICNTSPSYPALPVSRSRSFQFQLDKEQSEVYSHMTNLCSYGETRSGPNVIKLPEYSFGQSNSDQRLAAESSSLISGLDGVAQANRSNVPNVTTEQKILLAYWNYKSLKGSARNGWVSFVKYLHSTVCTCGTCVCTQYSVLSSHFDNCNDTDCYICWPLKLFCDPAIMPPILEISNPNAADFSKEVYEGPVRGDSKCMHQPRKRLKKEIAYGVNATGSSVSQQLVPITVQHSSPQRCSGLHEQPISSVSIPTKSQDDMTLFTKPVPDSTNINVIKYSQNNNSENSTVGIELLVPQGSEVKVEDINLNGKRYFAETISENPNQSDLSISVCTTTSNPAQAEETLVKSNFSTTRSVNVKSPPPEADNKIVVSLIEFFTAERIREHMKSLKQQREHERNLEEKGVGFNLCQLCGLDKLLLTPVPIYCSFCGARIKRKGQYYCKEEDFATQYCFCISCFRQSRGASINFNGISVAKTMLHRKRNDEETEESWVQCDRCEEWQHQICSLYNDQQDLEGKASYVCPKCCLEEIENGKRVPRSKKYAFCAKDLPKTPLSDHIEQRLAKRLQEEREGRANVEGKKVSEVLGAEDLTVRVALSVVKQLKVKQQFLDIFPGKKYPTEFSYRSKVVLLFQKVEGVDVCLFGLYVQEFGSECRQPNQRCVYISYLDSVKYFRPEIKTSSGEALRTFVYHEILIGYLEFCKKQGFTTCYLWACPPLKGEDYILYCHPEIQRTPKSEKLRQWYQVMLGKASEENIVVGVSNIYDEFFVSTGDSNSKITASRLPYFDGDYWSGAALDLMRNIEQKNGGDYQRELKKIMTKRALKTMGHTNPSDVTAKDILLMQKLGQSILPVKEDFMIVHLQFVCMQCREVILSGRRWFCRQCKNFQLCDRCHTSDHDLGLKDTHTAHGGEIHTLSQVTVYDIPFCANEKDVTVDNSLFENRHTFLSFCQKKHFQFDTLRRAKHSSMMILHHLRNPSVLTIEKMCSICCQGTVVQQSWSCKICTDFILCVACYKLKGAECHMHQLIQSSPASKTMIGSGESHQNALMTRRLLDVIQHASQCQSLKDQPCTYPYCVQIKKLFGHANRCTIRASGGCQHCKKAWLGLSMHSRHCRESDCRIPRCMDLKRHAEWLASQSDVRRRAAILELSR